MTLHRGDCATIGLPTGYADLVFTSPPYEDARTYPGHPPRGQEWVDWAIPRFLECLRVTHGLVCWVVQGRTRGFQWSATPALLMADLHRRGVCLRNPPIFHRVGVPGSGGPDWLRSDYEWIICATPTRGRLSWSDNTALGHPPIHPRGGRLSNRLASGARASRPAPLPAIANPGNVIKRSVGGDRMGSPLAHKNEAPFPESLADFFVLSFCPPGGLVVDPMCGSGTTLAVALAHGRRAYGMDTRASQIALTRQRLSAPMGKGIHS